MNLGYRGLVIALAVVGLLTGLYTSLSSTTLLAQSLSGPVCMIKSPASAVPLTVMANQSRQGELEAAGFAVQACAGKEATVAQYRSDVCSLASGMPPAAKLQFQHAYGVTPEWLCQLAGEIA